MKSTTPNWAHQTIWLGDNLDIMRGMNSATVDLIYLDPPFKSDRKYAGAEGSKAAEAHFKDTWTLDDVNLAWYGLIQHEYPHIYQFLSAVRGISGNSMMSYLITMTARLMEMRRILKPGGSVYLHCDPHASHYLKVIMDQLFGQNNFRNEIIWSYNRFSRRGDNAFPSMHDHLLFYGSDSGQKFNVLHTDPRDTARYEKGYHTVVDQGVKKLLIYDSKKARASNVDFKKYDKITYTKAQAPRMGDVWNIPIINPRSKERTGYPTQKPLALLRRIIETSSNPGDMILDPFCGCATTCIAAEQLERKWVGIDIGPKTPDMIRHRMRAEIGLIYAGVIRDDIPKRTDLGKLPPYNSSQNKKYLYGEQGGYCNGCGRHHETRDLEVDHIIARTKGGTDHISNLQLLCPSCNRIKGKSDQETLIIRLTDKGYIKRKHGVLATPS